MDNPEILRDAKRLPIKTAMRKHNLTHNEARALRGLPPLMNQREKSERRRGRVNLSMYQRELQTYVDRYNRQHGTDFVPLLKELSK